MISKGQVWKFKESGVRFLIISDDDTQRWGLENEIGWGFHGLDIPYGKTKEEVVYEGAMMAVEILEMAELVGEKDARKTM